MPIVVCPNCGHEFLVGNEIIGVCPNCKIKLIFKEGNEIVEKVDIKKIESIVDKIRSIGKQEIIEIKEIKSENEIEKKVDKVIS